MNSSAPYSIVLTDTFRHWAARVVKAHYKKIPKDRTKFDERLQRFFEQVAAAPHKVPFAWSEPWPKNCHNARYKFYKLDFKMPGLRHAAEEGRIMWLVCDDELTVYVIWIYTHDEFKKRPEDKDLRKALEAAMSGVVEVFSEAATRGVAPVAPPVQPQLEGIESPGPTQE